MSEFRKRVLDPLLLPVAAFVFVGGIAWGLSRILLVTTKDVAAGVALAAALAVLVTCGVIATHGFRRLEKAGAAFAFLAIVAGGSVMAATLEIRPIHGHVPEPSAEIVAVESIRWETTTLAVPAEEVVVVRFVNRDPTAPHNWGFQREKVFGAGPSLVDPGPALPAGKSFDYVLEKVPAGAYTFFCYVHPSMVGTLTVGEGGTPAPAPVESPTVPAPVETKPSPGGPPAPSAAAEISALNLAFDVATLTLAAGGGVTITFDNKDSGVPHNVAIYEDAEFTKAVFSGEIFSGPAVKDYTFAAPPAGAYSFRCDVHPNMKGTVEFV